MRKQYDVYEYAPSYYTITLYHDGVKVGVEKRSSFAYEEYLEELENQGYTLGYTKDDIEEARKRYEYMYENRIER